jgi:hypothetical protein
MSHSRPMDPPARGVPITYSRTEPLWKLWNMWNFVDYFLDFVEIVEIEELFCKMWKLWRWFLVLWNSVEMKTLKLDYFTKVTKIHFSKNVALIQFSHVFIRWHVSKNTVRQSRKISKIPVRGNLQKTMGVPVVELVHGCILCSKNESR